jgi:hypothetical protein
MNADLRKLWLGVAGLMAVCASGVCHAELPNPRLTRLTPLGGAAGTTVEVEVDGPDIEEATTLRFEQPGLAAQFVEGKKFKVAIAADVPEGTYEARLIGKYGITNSRLFAVTRGLTDVLDVDPNNSPEEAQRVELESVIYGMSDGNGQDVYRVKIPAGKRVVFDCQAQRLETMLDGNLTLTTADGRPVAASADYYGRDPLIDFIAPAEGEYLLTVNDLSYRGGLPYRVIVTTRPHLETVFPRAVQAGQRVEFLALGRNLPGGAKQAGGNEPPFEEVRFGLDIPSDLSATGAFRFLEHPTDHSVVSTLVNFPLTGFQTRGPQGMDSVRPVGVAVFDRPVLVETEPNSEVGRAQPLTLPAIVAGRFDEPRDADWFAFQVPENGQYYLEIFSERLGARADPYAIVFDDMMNVVVEFDDYGHRVRGVDAHLRDPYGSMNLQKEKPYKLLVQDRYSRGGPRYQYVLSLRAPQPDFQATTMWGMTQNIRAGGYEFLDIVLNQADGFSNPVTITAEGLPPGVSALPCVVSNTIHGQLILKAEANAPKGEGAFKVWATGKIGDAEVRREVKPSAPLVGQQGGNRPIRELVVGVREAAPFAVRFEPDRVECESGKSVEVRVVAQRIWPEFQAAIPLVSPGVPGFLQIGNNTIPAGQTELKFNLNVQGGLRPGTYTVALWCQAQVPFSKDPAKQPPQNTLVTLPTAPLTVVVPEPKKP